MKKSPFALTLTALVIGSASFAATSPDSPIVMTIGPEKVTLAEFEYLFNKNNEQQATSTSLNDYIDMFVNYKLKVLAAKDAGYDTSRTYLADMSKYTQELARPYLRTTSVDDSLKNVAYDHMKEMVKVRHILIPSSGMGFDYDKQKQLADSVRQALEEGADFGEMARKYSFDKGSAGRGGELGYIVGGMWPYTFEDIVYTTPVGAISPVVASNYGFHIVQPLEKKSNPGTVKTRHILKSTSDKTDEQAKKSIDSLYRLVKSGADFAVLARENTDEPQGKQSGGDLPWFAPGQMVSEFSDMAFSMSPGQVSEPVKTNFGWHIILCEGRKPLQPLDSVADDITKRILNDERSSLAVKRTIDNWKAAQGVTVITEAVDSMRNRMAKPGMFPENTVNEFKTSSTILAKVGDTPVTVADVAKYISAKEIKNQAAQLNDMLQACIDRAALNSYTKALEDREPDYRNLINEYRDGMLLYEVSNAEIWNKANADTLGLQRFYETHINDYKWDKPHYKGYILAAISDSLANEATKFIADSTLSSDQTKAQQAIRKRFGNDVKLEKVLAGKGENAVIDCLCFDGPEPAVKNRWKSYRKIRGRVIDAPENARDVKGQVSLGYQQELEAKWLKELHKRYKVKIDKKLLNKTFNKK